MTSRYPLTFVPPPVVCRAMASERSTPGGFLALVALAFVLWALNVGMGGSDSCEPSGVEVHAGATL